MEKPKKPKIIRVRLLFDPREYVFDSTFPKSLEGKMLRGDFDSVLHRINTQLNLPLRAYHKKLETTYRALLGTVLFGMWVILIPFVLLRSEKQRANLEVFGGEVKRYLETCSQKVFRKKGFTWTLVYNDQEPPKNNPDSKSWRMSVELASYFSKATDGEEKENLKTYAAIYESLVKGKKAKKRTI